MFLIQKTLTGVAAVTIARQITNIIRQEDISL